MTAVVVTALGTALGAIGLFAGIRPANPSLRIALAELERYPTRVEGLQEARPRSPLVRLDRYFGAQLAVVVSERVHVESQLWPLLSITGVTVQELCGEVLLSATVGFLLPGSWWVAVTAGGVHVPFAFPLWTGLASACVGGALPIVLLRSKATRARRSARKVVGSFLNLVVLCLAGGMGIEGALHASARIGEDEISGRILNELVLAQDAGDPPWDALDRLGRDLGLTELTELAAAVGLAGAEGARIRTTLAAKASSIRRHELAEAESEANSVTERLFLPGVFLLLGFLVFIGYPAVARISSGL